MQIPILSGIVGGLRVFFKTRRYVAYTIVFVATTFMALFVSFLMTQTAGTPVEDILVYFFAYVGSTGTIYFALGTFFIGLGLDRVWITRRGRGRVTEMKGLAWMAVSFAISVFMSIILGEFALLFFALFCWVGWIAFQAYLSTRTSLRIATLVEPKKGGILVGAGSLILLLLGLGMIGAEALAALYLIPFDVFGMGTMVEGIFANAMTNIMLQYSNLIIAYVAMGLFALVMLVSFIRYARRGASLNIALLTIFIAFYAGYFLVNVMRRVDTFGMTPVDIGMSIFFLLYAMSGIGRTVTEAVEESRARTRDFGPLLTFFLASGFFFVDSIIAVQATPGTAIGAWFSAGILGTNYALFLFRDVAKLIAFPITAIFTALYYLRVERSERIIERAEESGEELRPDEVDKEIVEEMQRPAEGESYKEDTDEYERPSDPRRLSVDKSRRLGKAKRFGEDED
ncbi:MAG: hypothetical protein ACP6KW_02785 [Candidatus Thorarchaeota archaeon]